MQHNKMESNGLTNETMNTLTRMVTDKKEQEFCLCSNAFLRPPLKQIEDSIYNIKRHFLQKVGLNVTPTAFQSHLAEIKDDLITVLEKSNFLFTNSIITEEDIHQKGEPQAFAFLSRSLGIALDFPVLHNLTSDTFTCDTFIALPYQPVLVLTLVDGNRESETARAYNTHVAREVTMTLRKFLDESFNVVFGVLSLTDLKEEDSFWEQINRCAQISSFCVTKRSLSMPPPKYEKVLQAFWAGVAETKSILVGTEIDKAYLRFLTKEQCIVLVENINNREVIVICQPGCGASTLMLEVARRLSNFGKTLIVCRSEEERNRLRSVFSNTFVASDLKRMKLSEYKIAVDETGTLGFGRFDWLWQFIRGEKEKTLWQSRMNISEMFKSSLELFDEEDATLHLLDRVMYMDSIQYQPYGIVAGRALEAYWKNNSIVEMEAAIREWRQTRQDLFLYLGNLIRGVKKMIVELQAVTEYLEQGNNEENITEESTTESLEPEIMCEQIQRLSIHDQQTLPNMPVQIAKQKKGEKTSNTLIHHLRDLQYGRFQYEKHGHYQKGQTHMFRILEQAVNKDHVTLQKLQMKCDNLEQKQGFPVYIVGEIDSSRSSPVSCPSMTLDSDRVHGGLHVSEDGLELENTKRQGDSGGFSMFRGGSGGFSQFYGTCSRLPIPIPIPIPPSPSTLTTPRYWETRTRVRVEKVVSWQTLLEMGVCGEGEVDTTWFVSWQRRDSWTVMVEVCHRHNGICTQVWSEGRQVRECRTNTMSNTPGTTQDLNYGVVLDVGRGVVAFLDLDREVVLSSFNVQFRESLCPMFGVCTYPSYYTVKMRLVSGGEITMTDTKKHLIYQALSIT